MEDPSKKRRRRSRHKKSPGTGPQSSSSTAPRPRSKPHSQKRRPGQTSRPQQGRGREQTSRSVPKGQLPENLVYGVNAVAVALEAGLLKRLFWDKSKQSERIQHIHAQAHSDGVDVQPIMRQGWSKILPTEMHQGIAGLLAEQPRAYLEEVVEDTKDNSCILVLDRIQDPQNLGAVLRTAAATGVDAVVLPKAGGCSVTPAVHKASAGMSLIVKIVEDENLSRALEFLKDKGYWVIGCDSGGGEDATTFEYPEKRVIVMGNEAEGMRKLVRDSCDYLVKIPMTDNVESLNISVATGVVLYLAQADLARAAYDIANGDGEGDGTENGMESDEASSEITIND